MKQQAEKKLELSDGKNYEKIQKEIEFNEKIIEIWQSREEKLRKQMADLEE